MAPQCEDELSGNSFAVYLQPPPAGASSYWAQAYWSTMSWTMSLYLRPRTFVPPVCAILSGAPDATIAHMNMPPW